MQKIAILDNGSQYTHLIKRNCRDLDTKPEMINNKEIGRLNEILSQSVFDKIIISGGPSSVYKKDLGLSGLIVKKIKDDGGIPLLGICFGHQLIAHIFDGVVEKGSSAEYGFSQISIDEPGRILKGIPRKFKAWVSHYDEVKKIPRDFIRLAHSNTCEIEVMEHRTRNIFSVQFHPEVWHTEHGEDILRNFLEI